MAGSLWWLVVSRSRKKGGLYFLNHSMTEPAQLNQGIGFELYKAIEIFVDYSKKVISFMNRQPISIARMLHLGAVGYV